MTLGDSFPPELKKELIEKDLIPGRFIYLFCPFTTPPKNKYFLVVSINPLVLLFIVNTSVNPFILNNPKLLEAQLLLKQSDYSFLDHDSYLACHEIINQFTLEEIKKILFNDLSRIKGFISQANRDEIVKILNKNMTLTLKQRVHIINSLSAISYIKES
jgi:hypothetical protein